MRFLSVCSGIEAASVAWAPLGWKAAAFSEIEPFPCAVLTHHYGASRPMFMPDPAAADSAKEAKKRRAAIKAVADLPETGRVPNLGDMTQFQEWPDPGGYLGPIDLVCGGTPCQAFSVAGFRQGLADPRGNLALTFLAIVDRYRPRWVLWENVPGVLSSNGGRDFGAFLAGLGKLGYGWAYRVLDAQYVRVDGHPRAVPQRRRRVFVVGYLGDWRHSAAVFFEPARLLGSAPPRRKTGQDISGTLGARASGGGGFGTDFDLDGAIVSPPLLAKANDSHDDSKQAYIPQAFGGGNTSGAIDVAACLTAAGQRIDFEVETFVVHALRGEGFDASEDGTGRGTPIVPVALDCKGTEVQCLDDGSHPTLCSMGHHCSHQNAGGHAAVCYDPHQITSRENRSKPSGDICHTLPATATPPHLATRWVVRRLTPTECERLQGFPDGYTDVPYRRRNCTPDGPRYKAIGNSWPLNSVEWIGRRIQLVEDVRREIGGGAA